MEETEKKIKYFSSWNLQENLIDENGKNQEFDDLVLLMAKAEQDQCVLEKENETLTEEIETLKTNLKSRVSDI